MIIIISRISLSNTLMKKLLYLSRKWSIFFFPFSGQTTMHHMHIYDFKHEKYLKDDVIHLHVTVFHHCLDFCVFLIRRDAWSIWIMQYCYKNCTYLRYTIVKSINCEMSTCDDPVWWEWNRVVKETIFIQERFCKFLWYKC